MKIPAILTCLLAVLLTAVPVRQARADDVSFDVFYNNLADDGDWYNTPEYGYVWHPTVADKSEKWRPYTDGYWAQTDDGWTWVSYENFGWATYHYGRWTRLKDLGWAWVPGYDWGPGWVSWRTSDDYVGWAPLPPKAEQGVYEGRVVDNPRPAATAIDYNDVEPEDYGSNVDVQYDIGPENYCFVDTHNFGAPVLAEVLLPPPRNVVIIQNTVNVTNIYRSRGSDNLVVYNHGPDFNFINAHSERPIQQLRIERHDDLGFLRSGIHGGGNANQVRSGVFSVAAPSIARGPVNLTQVKPARVKQTIDRPQVVHGWSNAGDPATVQRLRDQFKQQAQNAPPPRRDAAALPASGRAASNVPPNPSNGGGQPFLNQPNAGPRQPLTDADKAARRDAAQRERDARDKAAAGGQPAPAHPAAGTPAANNQPLTPEEREARGTGHPQVRPPSNAPGGQPFERAEQPAAHTPAAAPADADREARRAHREQEKANPAPRPEAAQPRPEPTQSEAENPAKAAREAHHAERQPEQAAPQRPEPTAQPEASNPAKEAREARHAERQPEQAAPQRVEPTETPRPKQPTAQPEAQNPAKEAREARHAEHQADQPARSTPSDKGDDRKKPNQPGQ